MAIDTDGLRTRRAVLSGALGGAAAAVALAIEHASPTSAANGDVVHVGHSYSSSAQTEIVGTGSVVIKGTGTGGSIGVYGRSDAGTGVTGLSQSGSGVLGRSGTQYGVHGEGDSGPGVYGHAKTAAGVYGESNTSAGVVGNCDSGTGVTGSSNSGYGVAGTGGLAGVYGDASGSGTGVKGHSDTGRGVAGVSVSGEGVFGASSSASAISGETNAVAKPAILGWSKGGNSALQGFSGSASVPASPKFTGVFGSAGGAAAAIGVKGASSSGRGGLFSGKLAQVRLLPSSQATHPASGKAGDLFLDKTNRLWFCRGGSTWKRLA